MTDLDKFMPMTVVLENNRVKKLLMFMFIVLSMSSSKKHTSPIPYKTMQISWYTLKSCSIQKYAVQIAKSK